MSLEILCKIFNIVKIEKFSVSVASLNCKCYFTLLFLFSFTTTIFFLQLSFEYIYYKCDVLGNK